MQVQLRTLPALVALALTLAGCGTTVPHTTTAVQQRPSVGDGLVAPNAQASTPTDGNSITTPTTGTPKHVGSSVAPAGAAGSVTTSTATKPGGGVPSQPVKVGFEVAPNNTDAAFKAAGA